MSETLSRRSPTNLGGLNRKSADFRVYLESSSYRCRILGGVEILQNRGNSVAPADYTHLAVREQPPRTKTCRGYPGGLICGAARLLTKLRSIIQVILLKDLIAKEFT